MLLTFIGGTSLDPSAPRSGLWQIGEVVEELLEQYKIDLSEAPVPSIELIMPDGALAVCA